MHKIYTPIGEASILSVVKAVKDPCGLALPPPTTNIENALEDIMLEEDIPEGQEVTCHIHKMKPISLEAKDIIVAPCGPMWDLWQNVYLP